MKAVIGEVWKSETLNQSFLVTSGEEIELGLGRWGNEIFCGYRAKRDDGFRALVDLSKKPDDYPYDFVLLD